MIEVEVKLKINSVEDVISKLKELGFSEAEMLRETDTYFDNKEGAIRHSDRALRIRETYNYNSDNSCCQINFKDKKYDNKSMSRPEFETEVNDAESMIKIINGLGFFPVEPKVIKKRQILKSSSISACVDTVEGLGNFLELEIITDSEQDRETELKKIESVISALGYGMADTTTTSYLSALQGLSDH